MKTTTISLPTFGGFYESLWLNSDTTYNAIWQTEQANDCELKHADGWDIDYQTYSMEVGTRYTKFIEQLLNDMDLQVELHFSDIWSPRYYNFETDRIYAVISWADDYDLAEHLLAYMRKYQPRLSEFIARYHTSRDGFWSFMDNDYRDWYGRISLLEQSDFDSIYLSYLLAYLLMCEHDCNDLYEIDYMAYENIEIYAEDYVEPQSDEAKGEWEQMSINFQIAV